jgi:aromatic ring-opening dioxygenase LigB subunit
MITSICLAPHGDELLGDDRRFSLIREIMGRCGADAADAASLLIVSPHGVRVSSNVSISRSERMCSKNVCYAVERELAHAIYMSCESRDLPCVFVGFGTDSGEESVLPLDWGSEIPLRFFPQASRIVVAVPPRDVPWDVVMEFGEAAAEALESAGEPVGVVISADQAHAHSPSGPYGYSPRAKEFDAAIIGMIRRGRLEDLLRIDRKLVEDAKPDSPWQLLILAGMLRTRPAVLREYAYQVAGYYGMLAARYGLTAGFTPRGHI